MISERDNDTADALVQAFAAIRNADLQYPDDRLLECFLGESIDPEAAARYMLQRIRCSAERNDLDFEPLLSDWKHLIASFTNTFPLPRKPDRDVVAKVKRRDGGKCSITRLKGSFNDPLVVAPILSMTQAVNDSLHEMLGVFVGTEMQQRIVSDNVSQHDHRNHWLVRKSVALALSQGLLHIRQIKIKEDSELLVCINTIGDRGYSILNNEVLRSIHRFKGQSASGTDTPEDSLLQAVSRFAKPLRWVAVAGEIANKRPRSAIRVLSSSLWHFLVEYAAASFSAVCRLLPVTLRIRAYRFLELLGTHLYEPSHGSRVQRLPFGMYLKTADPTFGGGLVNEYGALKLVRRHTDTPVPRPLDFVSDMGMSYMLTAQVPGGPAWMSIDTLTKTERDTFSRDLHRYLAQLRAVPKEVAPHHAICDALGKPCYDYRIVHGLDYEEERGYFIGPFADEDEFNNTLQIGALPGVSHTGGHSIVLTHGDLNMRNVLIHNGRLSGIGDWENAGWYPEYWDYTKAHFATKTHRRWLEVIEEVFEKFGDYKKELAIERQFWNYCY
ncbi:kinase-like domain-containing protein [Xylariaceae sp. FL0594]|nr:kinase-like domain-containing protein [Xylariaceae sp. FL0594]